jgi:glycosyltransferase involved in cell wall biosynthesis
MNMQLYAPHRILMVHNRYRHSGGEDRSVEALCSLLRAYGHDVREHYVQNADHSPVELLATGLRSIWNGSAASNVAAAIDDWRPDIVNVHNTFPLLSWAILPAIQKRGIPLVLTLHNFRCACANSMFSRNGCDCNACIESFFPWPAIRHRCYRSSITATLPVAFGIWLHKMGHTLENSATVVVAGSEFHKAKLLEAGLRPSCLRVCAPPITLPSPAPFQCDLPKVPGRVCYVGRLMQEKGIRVLLEAWATLKDVNKELLICGQGPDLEYVRIFARDEPSVKWRGFLGGDEVLKIVQASMVLVNPSLVPETFGRVVVEAFACGTAVIASRVGGLPELVLEGTGFLVEPGDPMALAAQLAKLLGDPLRTKALGERARREVQSRFDPQSVYDCTISVYRDAIARVTRG